MCRFNEKSKVIGITGSIACGKTTVTDIFVSKGAEKIDADAIGHKLLSDDVTVQEEVLKVFGEIVITNNSIDRSKLAKEVFFNKDNLDKLSFILHPRIINIINDKIKRSSKKIVVLDAPLLIETELYKNVDIVVVVHVGLPIQLERTSKRGITEDMTMNIIKNQMTFKEKSKFADFIIYNDNNFETIKEGVDQIWQKL